MRVIRSVNPFKCRMWDLHDRLDDGVDEDSCREEIESMEKHGQLVPVLARPLREDPNHEFELIFGARRLFTCRHINRPLDIEVRQMTDREAIIAMDIENRQRKDLSPYERGMSYERYLRRGHFASQDEMARSLDVSPSQVSRLLRLARLPSIVIDAFGNAREICESWGLDLVDALNDSGRRQQTISRARTIAAASPRIAPSDVYRELIAASPLRRLRQKAAHDEVVSDNGGVPLFRVRYQRHGVAILLPIKSVPVHSVKEICGAITEILQRTGVNQTASPKSGPPRRSFALLESLPARAAS